MKLSNEQKKILSFIFVIGGIFIGGFTLTQIYEPMLAQSKYIDTLKQEKEQKTKHLKELQKLSESIHTGTGKEMVDRYLFDFSDTYFLKYFHKYVYENNPMITIDSLTVNPWQKNEYWLYEGSVQIHFKAQNETAFFNFLRFIIENKEHAFFVHDFPYFKVTSYPKDFQLSIKVLYYK